MSERTKNIFIGLFVTAALSAVVMGLFFINPKLGDEGKKLRVRFSNIDKVNVGTRVTLAGRPVGVVTRVEPFDNGRSREKVGPVYVYELELAIDSKEKIYKSDKIALHTSGLMGEKSIAIIPQQPPEGTIAEQVDDGILYADCAGSMEETFSNINTMMGKANCLLDNLVGFVENNDQRITNTFDSMHRALDHLAEVMVQAEKADIMTQMGKTFETIGSATGHLNQTITLLNEQGFWQNISDTAQNIKEASAALNDPQSLRSISHNIGMLSDGLIALTAKIDAAWPVATEAIDNIAATAASARASADNIAVISASIRNGEGTVGKLLQGDELALKLDSVLTKGEVLMNDVNHYGLLFHLDKSWQRQRTKKMNLIGELQSTGTIKEHFEREMDEISTGLARVSALLDKAEGLHGKRALLDDTTFQKDLAQLMQRVSSLEGTLGDLNAQLHAPIQEAAR